MIKIISNNRKDEIILTDNELVKVNNDYHFYVDKEDTDWEIEIIFEIKNNKITRIKKQFSSADGYSGDIISEYCNLLKSANEIVLSDSDFIEVKRLLLKLKDGDKYKIKTLVNSYAHLLAYEYYVDTVIYELDKISVNQIFFDMYLGNYYVEEKKKYIKEIIDKTKEILREEYNVNLDNLIDGGTKNE